MIPKELLALTSNRALSIGVYGSAGLKKTLAIHTLPPPIAMCDWEDGALSLLPWTRRKRESTESTWTNYSDELRQHSLDSLRNDIRKDIRIKPYPAIDIIHFDPTRYEAYDEFVEYIATFNIQHYNSLAIDSMQELSAGTQIRAKGPGNQDKMMNEAGKRAWGGAQERANMQLRKLVNYRSTGIFIYVTASEDIAKDYVTDPQSRTAGDTRTEEPYSIRGTVNLPGKLANVLPHAPDVLAHARLLNNAVTWITEPEPISNGAAWWDAKDRTGRLDKYVRPSIYSICCQIYGRETTERIYAQHGTTSELRQTNQLASPSLATS